MVVDKWLKLFKMFLVRIGSYVTAFIGHLSVKSWFLFWGIDLEGVKDLKLHEIAKEAKMIIYV